jgi:hypothetical protein
MSRAGAAHKARTVCADYGWTMDSIANESGDWVLYARDHEGDLRILFIGTVKS